MQYRGSRWAIALGVSLGLASAAYGADPWGTCPATPAVVNSVTVSPLQEIRSLRGTWDFVADTTLHGRHGMGKGPGWNEPDWKNVRPIEVPGAWEAQGVGEPGMSQPWDMLFDRIPRPINHAYVGTARYRRSEPIPSKWAGKRIWLKVGGVRTEAWLWVNQQRVAHLNTYCGTYKYDITEFVTPGEPAEIVATVRNDSPSRKGCMAAYHRFGGFYRDIELEATPTTRIDDVWVRSDIDRGVALVHVSVRHTGSARPGNIAVDVAVRRADGGSPAGEARQMVALDADGSAELVCEVPLREVRLWSPESPNLYLADVTLSVEGDAIHGWLERFGMRKFEVRGDRFYLNGQPFFVRGFGDDYIYPLTLTSPPDRVFHLEHLKKARAAGFNFVRLHTHCENPEYFEAADEAGILIQPELPYYHDITTEAFAFDPLRDIQELYRHFRRYVSFGAYCTGNEGHLGSPIDEVVYQWVKENDPDRPMQHQDGGYNSPANSDFTTPNGYGLATSIVPWERGAFSSLDRPFVAHEYLNLGIKMDPRIAPKFTGAIPSPRSMEDYERALEAAGLSRAWGDACLDSAHALQGYYQKRGLELARLDPDCDGYSYWTIVDVMVEQAGTYTGQGFLNAFWEQKSGGLSLEEFSRFNGATALLANIDPNAAVAVSGDEVEAPIWISHFGAEPIVGGVVSWRLRAGEDTLASGEIAVEGVAPGDVKAIGAVRVTVPSLERPVHAMLDVELAGADIRNAWDYWLFPERAAREVSSVAVSADLMEALSGRYRGLVRLGTPKADAATVVIGSWKDPAFVKAIEEGKRGIMIGPAEGEPNIRLGWWSLGDQIGTAFAEHPVFGDFPQDGALSPLWFRLIKRGLPLPLEEGLGDVELLAVGEGQQEYFMYMAEARGSGKGSYVMTHGIDLLADTPEGNYLLDQMIAYVQGDE